MGKSNIAVKQWLRNKERFADLFNGMVFNGKSIVLPEELEEVDGESDIIITDKKILKKEFKNIGILRCGGNKARNWQFWLAKIRTKYIMQCQFA